MSETPDTIEIVVKSSADKKYNLTVSPSLKVSELKADLAGKCDIPADRQRLIFSGRVLKDNDTLESCKITKSGQTIHLVRGAAPPGSSSATTSSSNTQSATSQTPSTPQAPSNISAGTGSGNMLADLTGARYAGFANLPSANMFGPDGGMGPPPNSEDLMNMMETPGFSETMQQALQNPAVVDMMINSNPQLQGMGPQFRQMLQSEEFRQMLTNPQMMRQMMQMERMFGGARGESGAATSAFPAPGSAAGDATESAAGDGTASRSNPTSTANNANPFAALLQGGAPFGNTTANPNAANPMFNPQLLQSLFGGAGAGAGAGTGAVAETQDTRPPEERYESQLQQLNELGFVDFDRNVRALRRSGGNVQGAVEALLDGQV